MKTIPISNGYELHVYLVKKSVISPPNDSAPWHESWRTDDSRDLELDLRPELIDEAFGDTEYIQGAKNLIGVTQQHHCMKFLDAFVDVFAQEIVDHWKECSDRPDNPIHQPRYQAVVRFIEDRQRSKTKST